MDKKYPPTEIRKRRRTSMCQSAPYVGNQSFSAPVQKMTSESEVENVFVAIDVQNLWVSCQNLFGDEYRISFTAIKQLIYRGNPNRNLTIYSYVVSNPHIKFDPQTQQNLVIPPKNKRFIEYLEKIGFKVKEKRLRFEKTTLKHFSADWSIGITIDAIDNIENYNTFCLITGDGDYSTLIQTLKDKGKRTEVITFRSVNSRFIHETADLITYLGDLELFREKPIKRNYRESGFGYQENTTKD